MILNKKSVCVIGLFISIAALVVELSVPVANLANVTFVTIECLGSVKSPISL